MPGIDGLPPELHRELVPPPRVGDKVCPLCRSWRAEEYEHCYNCQQAVSAIGMATPVLPLTLYRKPSDLRDWLTYYKPGRDLVEAKYGEWLRDILIAFFNDYCEDLARFTGPVDDFLTVPATGASGSSFAGVCQAVLPNGESPVADRIRWQGQQVLRGRFVPDDFWCSPETIGRRVVLMDDVYVTGTRAQSAAAALARKGATVLAILVLGRRVNPDYNEAASKLWETQRALDYQAAMPYW